MSAYEPIDASAGIPLKTHVDELRSRCEAVARLQGGSTHYLEELAIFRRYAGEKGLILPAIFTKRLGLKLKEWGHSCPHPSKLSGDRRGATPLKLYGKDQWAWGAHLRREQRARRVRQRRKLPNQYVADTWAMACMNMIIHDMEGTIEIGDNFKNPKFRDKRGKLRTFHRAVG